MSATTATSPAVEQKHISDKLAEFLANDEEAKVKYPHLVNNPEAVKGLFGGIEPLLADMEGDLAEDAANAVKAKA